MQTTARALAACVLVSCVTAHAPPGTGQFEPWLKDALQLRQVQSKSGELDLRVTRALGPRGYDKVRISVVTEDDPTPPQGDVEFTYSAEFQHRWTQWKDNRSAEQTLPRRFLHSALVPVTPGVAKQFHLNGQSFTVSLPKSGGDFRGYIVADPCFSSKWIGCEWAPKGAFTKAVDFLNAATAGDGIDQWMILGDNFYDQTGVLTDLFFSKLTMDVKSKFVATTVGNHDMWVCGGNECGDQYDQHGIGTMQWYAMDTAATPVSDEVNFLNFAVNPDQSKQWHESLNDGANLVWFHTTGDIGFIAFSGAFNETELKPHFESACKYMDDARPSWIFVLNHWNEKGSGNAACNPCVGMDTPDAYWKLRKMPGCAEFGDRLMYQDGHTHCNNIQENDPHTGKPIGFMIGGHGMSGCGQFGFEYLEAVNGKLDIVYFELENNTTNVTSTVLDCVRAKGMSGCKHLGTSWRSETVVSKADVVEVVL